MPCDLVFIRHDIMCLTHSHPPSLEAAHIPDSETGPARHIQTFLIPPEFLPEGCSWAESAGYPNPTGDNLFPKYLSPSQPFLEKSEEAVVVFQFGTDLSWSLVDMLVHRRSLLQLL